MAIPKLNELIYPFLWHLPSEKEIDMSEIIESLAIEFSLTPEERRESYKKSGNLIFRNKVRWARQNLKMAGLIEAPRLGYVRITDEGRKVLANPPKRINHRFLMQYPGYAKSKSMSGKGKRTSKKDEAVLEETSDQTPEELIEAARDRLDGALRTELLEKLRGIDPAYFERLILNLLEKMGYGLPRHLGGTGDGGVDGVVEQDALGLDRVYIQAKRYQGGSSVGPEAIQAFSGSLNMHRVQKGLFVTSSSFSKRAEEAAGKLTQNIVLIDGEELARLMIAHNVGVRVKTTYEVKDVDEDFFEDL